jgi:hypothetical protein
VAADPAIPRTVARDDVIVVIVVDPSVEPPRASSVRTRVAASVAVCGAAIVIAGVAMWVGNRVPGERRFTAPGLAIVLAAGAVIVILRRLGCTAQHIVVGVLTCLAGALATAFIVPGWSVAQAVRDKEPALKATLNRLAAGHDGCFRPEGSDAQMAPVGHVDEICVRSDGGHFFATITAGRAASGLLYDSRQPTQAPVMSQCVHHLYGPWWEVSGFGTNLDCPVGFDGIGGG